MISNREGGKRGETEKGRMKENSRKHQKNGTIGESRLKCKDGDIHMRSTSASR